MGGGYIKCGDFLGDDKSGSAIFGIFDAIALMLPPDRQKIWQTNFLDAIEGQEEEQGILIAPQLVRLLAEPLKIYYEQLREKLGNPAPFDAPRLDSERGLNPTEAKWGAGDGWRYYCAHDLLRACEISEQTGESIIISFD